MKSVMNKNKNNNNDALINGDWVGNDDVNKNKDDTHDDVIGENNVNENPFFFMEVEALQLQQQQQPPKTIGYSEAMAVSDAENDITTTDTTTTTTTTTVSVSSSATTTAREKQKTKKIREWGLPTFSDQIDRGIRTYTFENTISVCINYRQHSTGSDIWDSALVLAYTLIQPQFVHDYLKKILQQEQEQFCPHLFRTTMESSHQHCRNEPVQSTQIPATTTTNTIAKYDENNDESNRLNNQTTGSYNTNDTNTNTCIYCTRDTILQGHTVLELGSGTGLVGLWTTQLGAKKVILTDLPENLPLIQCNINRNNDELILHQHQKQQSMVSTMALDWKWFDYHKLYQNQQEKEQEEEPTDTAKTKTTTRESSSLRFFENNMIHNDNNDSSNEDNSNNGDDDITLIIGSDLFLPFDKSLLRSLANTIIYLLHKYPLAQVLLCYEERFDCSDFFKYCTEQNTTTSTTSTTSTTTSTKNNNHYNNNTINDTDTTNNNNKNIKNTNSTIIIESISNTYMHPLYQDPDYIKMIRITSK